MENKKVKNEHSIKYTIDYEDPIRVNDFTASLNAFSNEYNKFIYDTYGAEAPVKAELCIQEIKKGSIVTTLVEYSELALPFLVDINTVVEFGKFLKSSLDYLSGRKNKENDDEVKLDIADLNNLNKIIKPGVFSGNNITIEVVGDNNEVNLNTGYNYIENRNISNEIKKMKGELNVPEREIHTKVPLLITNIKSDLDSKGNKGIIAELYDGERNLIWESEKTKEIMLKSDFNPINYVYIVDVETKKVSEEVKVYNIIRLHEYFEIDDI